MPVATGTPQFWQHPFEARHLVPHVGPIRTAVHDRLLDWDQATVGFGGEHCEIPGVALVGRIESNDQGRVRSRHGPGPSLSTG